MATVKFITDKNCQLFIDMELVGDVFVDKMLKISLEAGSYLVEGKDTNGKTIPLFVFIIKEPYSAIMEIMDTLTANTK